MLKLFVALASSSYENSADLSTLMPMVLVPPAAAGPPESDVSCLALPETSSERRKIKKSYYIPSSTIFSFSTCAVLLFHDMQSEQQTSFTAANTYYSDASKKLE